MKAMNHAKALREEVRLLGRTLGYLNDSDMACCAVTMAQCHALVEVGRAGTLSLRELSELLGLDNSTASRTINNLVNRGLVNRVLEEGDRRYVAITLTDAGAELFRGIEERMEARYREVCTAIPEGKLPEVLEALRLLRGALECGGCC